VSSSRLSIQLPVRAEDGGGLKDNAIGKQVYGKLLHFIREMQIQTWTTYHLTRLRMTIIKKTKINAGKDAEKRKFYVHCL
jgi:hypothetical protein